MGNKIVTFTASLLILGLTGCQDASQDVSNAQGSRAGLCDPSAAAALIGKGRISDGEAKKLTGAATVRQVKPGDAVTMDYRQDRVTIETDPKTDMIVRAACG